MSPEDKLAGWQVAQTHNPGPPNYGTQNGWRVIVRSRVGFVRNVKCSWSFWRTTEAEILRRTVWRNPHRRARLSPPCITGRVSVKAVPERESPARHRPTQEGWVTRGRRCQWVGWLQGIILKRGLRNSNVIIYHSNPGQFVSRAWPVAKAVHCNIHYFCMRCSLWGVDFLCWRFLRRPTSWASRVLARVFRGGLLETLSMVDMAANQYSHNVALMVAHHTRGAPRRPLCKQTGTHTTILQQPVGFIKTRTKKNFINPLKTQRSLKIWLILSEPW